jgi:fluoride exporter
MVYFWIAVGSALGGVLRHWCSVVAAQVVGEAFPWGTLVVNIAGSFAIGFFFTYTGSDGRLPVDPTTRQFVMAGICGGYTTFSSFSLQTLNLMRNGQTLHAGANILASVMFCLLAVWLGHVVAAELNQTGTVSETAAESRHAALDAPGVREQDGRLPRSEH